MTQNIDPKIKRHALAWLMQAAVTNSYYIASDRGGQPGANAVAEARKLTERGIETSAADMQEAMNSALRTFVQRIERLEAQDKIQTICADVHTQTRQKILDSDYALLKRIYRDLLVGRPTPITAAQTMRERELPLFEIKPATDDDMEHRCMHGLKRKITLSDLGFVMAGALANIGEIA